MKKGSRVKLPTPRELVEPFIEAMEPLEEYGIEWKATTSHGVQVQGHGGELHTAYGRVLVEAHVGQVNEVGMKPTFGFVYGLDLSAPEIQAYCGWAENQVFACLNLLILGARDLQRFPLLAGGDASGIEAIRGFVREFGRHNDEVVEKVNTWKATYLDEEELHELIGRLFVRVSSGQARFPASVLRSGVKRLYDPQNTRYSLTPEGGVDLWTMFNSMTQTLRDKAYPNVYAPNTYGLYQEILGGVEL